MQPNEYDNLAVFIIPKERRTNHFMCRSYRFQVTRGGANIHAFVSYSAFKRWLREHNLKLGKRGYYSHGRKIIGSFVVRYVDDTRHIQGDCYTMALHNGEYQPCVMVYTQRHTIKYVKRVEPENRQTIEEYRHYDKIFCG